MKIEKLLATAAVLLLATLAVQLTQRYRDPPVPRTFAVWRNRPASVEQAYQLSESVVQGVVIRVRDADPLVGVVPGQGSIDRIPVQVATVLVSRSYKGSGPTTMEIFRTGSGSTSLALPNNPGELPDPTGPAPTRPPGGTSRPPGGPDRSRDSQATAIVLDDDPAYMPGQRYVLFLRQGPALTVQGANLNTLAPVSPEGRFRVLGNGRLDPAAIRGWATQFRNQLLQDLEARIPR